MYLAAALVCVCLTLCSGDNMMCTPTQDAGRTTYTIPELHRAAHESDSQCFCTWANESDFVIANHRGQFMEPVMSSNFSTLVTSKCIGNITFSGTCISKGTAHDYTASCSTSCTPEALIEDKGNSWITVIAVVAVVSFLVLLACLLGFLCYKYKPWRNCSCSQTGGFYTAVEFLKNSQAV